MSKLGSYGAKSMEMELFLVTLIRMEMEMFLVTLIRVVMEIFREK